MKLKKLQQQFSNAIYAQDDAILKAIIPNHISPHSRMEIYRNNVRGNLRNSLALTYPAIQAMVGNAFFTQLSDLYIQNTPSISGNLDHYGKEFAAFIQDLKQLDDYPYLTDLARLEWLHHLAYSAADGTAFNEEAFAAIKPEAYEHTKLTLQPSLHFLASNYPVDQLYAVKDNPNTAINLEDGPSHIIIVRPQFSIKHFAVPHALFIFTKALSKAHTLYEAFEQATTIDNHFDLGHALGFLIKEAVLCNAPN